MDNISKMNGTYQQPAATEGRRQPMRGVISHRPSPIARWAFVIFAAILGIIVAVSWFIRYPEVVKVKAVIVQSATTGLVYAQVSLPGKYQRSLTSGQMVQLRLDDYAYDEFGYVPGILQQVSNASGAGLTGRIQLTQGLNTTRQKEIVYRPDLKAEALIFTRDVRLLERLLRKFNPMPDTQQASK